MFNIYGTQCRAKLHATMQHPFNSKSPLCCPESYFRRNTNDGYRVRRRIQDMAANSDRQKHNEGLKVARLFMVLSSLSPLFILWAIRGNSLIPDVWFTIACASMVVGPNFFLWYRFRTAKRNSDKRQLTVGSSEDHRSHVLVYLFATLLPFYREDLATYRDLVAALGALAFIVFLFWRLNLHYMNVLFALLGYRVFTVSSPQDENPYTGRDSLVLVTHRRSLLPDDKIFAYRLSDTVYWESGS